MSSVLFKNIKYLQNINKKRRGERYSKAQIAPRGLCTSKDGAIACLDFSRRLAGAKKRTQPQQMTVFFYFRR